MPFGPVPEDGTPTACFDATGCTVTLVTNVHDTSGLENHVN
jgi:hypothetical protein